MTRNSKGKIAIAVALSASLIGCGSSDAGGTASSAGSNSALDGVGGAGGASSQGGIGGSTSSTSGAGNTAAGAPAGDGQAFVPSTLPFNPVSDSASAQLKLLSATVRDYGTFVGLMVAVRNDSGKAVCNVTLNAAAETATDALAGELVLPVSDAMYTTTDEPAAPCLDVGQTGYAGGAFSFEIPATFSDITSIDYEPQGDFETIVSKITTFELSALSVVSAAGGAKALGGTVTNHGTTTLDTVSVSYVALDSGSRPYDYDYAQSDSPLIPGGTWDFTLSDVSTLGKYAAVATYVNDGLQ
jgi:hypothetical protein